MRRVLSIIYVLSTTTPLPISAIAVFIQNDVNFSEEDADSVGKLIRALHAVITEEKKDGAVRAFHPSFLDYLAAKMGQKGWDLLSLIHQLMFEGAFKVMLSELKFNICKLEDASFLNKNVEGLQKLVSEYISSELQYSSENWFAHLRYSQLTASNEGLRNTIFRLVCDMKIFFWLEVMSHTGAVQRSIHILQRCSQFFNVRIFFMALNTCLPFSQGYSNITQACNDAVRFVTSFSQAMASTPHLYVSALPWLPAKSSLRKIIGQKFRLPHL